MDCRLSLYLYTNNIFLFLLFNEILTFSTIKIKIIMNNIKNRNN